MDVAPKLQWHNEDLRLTYILGFWAKKRPKWAPNKVFQVFSKSGGMEFFYFLFEVAVNNEISWVVWKLGTFLDFWNKFIEPCKLKIVLIYLFFFLTKILFWSFKRKEEGTGLTTKSCRYYQKSMHINFLVSCMKLHWHKHLNGSKGTNLRFFYAKNVIFHIFCIKL